MPNVLAEYKKAEQSIADYEINSGAHLWLFVSIQKVKYKIVQFMETSRMRIAEWHLQGLIFQCLKYF